MIWTTRMITTLRCETCLQPKYSSQKPNSEGKNSDISEGSKGGGAYRKFQSKSGEPLASFSSGGDMLLALKESKSIHARTAMTYDQIRAFSD